MRALAEVLHVTRAKTFEMFDLIHVYECRLESGNVSQPPTPCCKQNISMGALALPSIHAVHSSIFLLFVQLSMLYGRTIHKVISYLIVFLQFPNLLAHGAH